MKLFNKSIIVLNSSYFSMSYVRQGIKKDIEKVIYIWYDIFRYLRYQKKTKIGGVK